MWSILFVAMLVPLVMNAAPRQRGLIVPYEFISLETELNILESVSLTEDVDEVITQALRNDIRNLWDRR